MTFGEGGHVVKCPQCRGTDCTQIELHLTDEATVLFFSCRRCEARWWEREGDTIALDEVLTIAAENARPKNVRG